ncbi:MAG TPA: cyclic nucleotide-binding domain-containing protein [Actinomycetota bacterium]|nr:cyclic nucleotide-binding domain-containing protein [Actinomycetota bacterium]
MEIAAGVVLVLVAGAFVGNLYASRRRATPGPSVTQALSRRLDGREGSLSPAAGHDLFGVLADRVRTRPSTRDGIWSSLAGRVEAAGWRPRLAPDVELKEFTLRWGNDYAVIANPRAQLHYRLEPGEIELVKLMDGTRTVKEIVLERFRESGDLELSGVADLVRELREGGFLSEPFVDVTAAVGNALDPAPLARRKAREFVKTLSIDWRGAHRLVEWFYRNGLRVFFVPWVSVPVGLVALGGLAAFVSVYRSGRFSLSGDDAVAATFILLALNYVLTFVHELAHALVLVRHGRRVKSAGFMIYFGSPAFFVDASDALMLGRRQRIAQAFAGPYAELVIAGAASIAVWALPGSPPAAILYKFALLNYFVIFLNLVPLLELDGYFILSDAIQVPDLRPRSLRFIQHDVWRKLRRLERFSRQEIGLGLYAVLGIAFTVLSLYWAAFFWEEVFGGLIRSLWNGGVGTRVLLLALALFVAGPLIRGAISLLRVLVGKGKAIVRAVAFRLQTGWRVEAAAMIDALPVFDDLPEDVLSDLAGRVRLRTYPAGKPVVRQGDRPEAFYVVRRGTLQVLEEDPEAGTERVLRTLGRGESFGELGLLDRAPRTASVRPVEDAQLFEVDGSTFDRLLARNINAPEFAPTLQAAAEVRKIPAFASLGADDLADVVEHGTWLNVGPGEVLIRQGEAGDAFYGLSSGRVEVLEDDRPIGTMGPGEHFGELALLADTPRTATVIARTPGRVFRLDRDAFDRVIASAFRRGTLNPGAAIDRTWQH